MLCSYKILQFGQKIHKNKMDNKYIYITILLVFGITIEGCIENVQRPIEISTYYEHRKLPNFELNINGADSYSKQKIYIILNNTDQNVVRYISSINIISNIEDFECNDNNNITGCTVGNFTIDGELKDVRIYILDHNLYKDLCNTFERTLYHEIGHIVYFYKFGNRDIQRQDKIYAELLELYAEKYADNHYKIQKKGCDQKTVEKLKYDIEEKEKIYKYSINVLSKWDKYKDFGIPKDMFEEYKYDYELYLEARKEYIRVVEKYKDYMKEPQE